MDEEKTIKEGTTKAATSNTNQGNELETANYVERAEKAALTLKAERELLDKSLAELRELTARNILGGRTLAGQSPVKEDEDPKEYANKLLAGKIQLK